MFKKSFALFVAALLITLCACGGQGGSGGKLHGVSTDDEIPETAKEVEGPAADSFESYDLTKERLELSAWTDDGFHAFLTKHDNGVLQIGKGGQPQSYADYIDYGATFEKLINMDIIFSCQSELNAINKLESFGQILFRAAKLENMGKRNPCYFIEYEDNGRFAMRLGKYTKDGLTYLARKVELEADYKPYEFNNLKVGLFNEDGKVRVLVYFNGKRIMNVLDEEPSEENLQAGHLFFENGRNVIYLRGTDDSSAELPVAHPEKASVVGTVQTYDISKMKDTDYSYRDLITVMKARTYKDENGAVVPYRLYLPTNYDSGKKYPIMIYLHGAGLKGKDNLTQIGGDRNFYKAFLDIQATEEMIFVIPQCSYKSWNDNDYDINYVVGYDDFEYHVKLNEETEVTAAVKHLLDDLSSEFSVDKTRRYISGASMGGMGAYGFLARYPDYFAAGIVGCAKGDLDLGAVYAKTPLWIGHGTLDPAINVRHGRDTANAVEAAGGTVSYNEYPDRYHDFSKRSDLLEAVKWALQFDKKQ